MVGLRFEAGAAQCTSIARVPLGARLKTKAAVLDVTDEGDAAMT
jgi:hypothetical protein